MPYASFPIYGCKTLARWLMGVLVLSACGPGASSETAPAKEFQRIQAEFDVGRTRLREEKKNAETALRARDLALRQMLREKRDEAKLEYTDWIALALAHELLLNNIECRRCCEQALKMEPEQSAPCLPLLRTLLRTGEGKLVEEHVAEFTRKFKRERDFVASLHLLLYSYFQANDQPSKAFDELAQTFVIECESVTSSARLHSQIVGHVRFLKQIAPQAQRETHLKTLLADLLQRLTDACDSRAAPFEMAMALRRLRLELAALEVPARVASWQAEWIDYASLEMFQAPDAKAVSDLTKLVGSVTRRSHLWEDARPLRAAVQATIDRSQQVAASPELEASLKSHRTTCEMLISLIDQHEQRAKLQGQVVTAPRNVRWLIRKSEAWPSSRNTLVVVWNPFAAGCHEIFSLIQQIEMRTRNNFPGQKSFDIVFLAPYCGLTWNEEQRAATRGAAVSREGEALGYSAFLKSLKVAARPYGLVEPDDPFFTQIGGDFFPAFLFLDATGKVEFTITGAEFDKSDYLTERLISYKKGTGVDSAKTP